MSKPTILNYLFSIALSLACLSSANKSCFSVFHLYLATRIELRKWWTIFIILDDILISNEIILMKMIRTNIWIRYLTFIGLFNRNRKIYLTFSNFLNISSIESLDCTISAWEISPVWISNGSSSLISNRSLLSNETPTLLSQLSSSLLITVPSSSFFFFEIPDECFLVRIRL